jgi:photosystem II stability/assembly factor-like uncharacterized protein
MKFFYTVIITFIIPLFLPVYSQQITIPDFLEYRNLGPYRAGAWISSIAVPKKNDLAYKYTYYVAGRMGGVWKTENNGTTFFPVYDSIGISSIGAVAVSCSHPDQVWVGTGEAYCARSTHAGRGVYKSLDGGNSWEFNGLEDTHHISTLLIHPDNPDIVYVAAMGHLFTPNEERGIFKTTDGGESWNKVLYIDANTGIIDLIIHPEDPDILFAAAYEKYRYPWHYEAGGESSGIYRSVDGGENWQKIESGLPEGKIGRIGLGICHNHPNNVYAVIENLNPKPGIVLDETVEMNHMRDPYFDQLIGGEVYRSIDGGSSWEKQNEDSCNVSAKAAYSFNKILIHPDDPDKIFVSSDVLISSEDGGKTWNDCSWPPEKLFVDMFGDIRSFWIDPDDGRHIMVGSDGGLYESYDGGETIYHRYQIPLGEIYMVETDDADPYNIYVGLQDHEAWKGPVNAWSGQVRLEDWDIIGMWDGMYTRVDPENNRWAYSTTQFGGHIRIDQVKGERVNIQPVSNEGDPAYRFPWTPPLEISLHNSQIIYTGGQMLLRSLDRGDNWEEISPDMTTNDSIKIAGRGHMMYCTITTISESPIKSGIIWIGTDDGRIHMTPDHGKTWNEFTDEIHNLGGQKEYWTTRVLSSCHDFQTAYICKSGFKHDNFKPMVFKTDDAGKTWEKITTGLPDSPVNVITEDPQVAELLYLGNDEGVFVSSNGGISWQPLRQNMPVVPVKDLKVQSRENDLVVGTYGRGAYVVDVSLIQQLDDSIASLEAYIYNIEPKPVRNYSERASWGNYEMTGDNHLSTPNEPNGWTIYYSFNLRKKPKTALMEILDSNEIAIDTVKIDTSNGIHMVVYDTWELTPGRYKVRLTFNKTIIEQIAILRSSPEWPVGHGLRD